MAGWQLAQTPGTLGPQGAGVGIFFPGLFREPQRLAASSRTPLGALGGANLGTALWQPLLGQRRVQLLLQQVLLLHLRRPPWTVALALLLPPWRSRICSCSRQSR